MGDYKFYRSQIGISVLSWMVLIAISAFFASMIFKMLPHYMDYMTLEKMITSVETEPSQDVRSVNDFYVHMAKGMEVNGMRDLNIRDILDVKVEGGEFRAHLRYETREPLIQNLDLVARFDKEFRVRMP